MCTIERANISTIDWSKTTVESNNAPIRCAALEPLKERHAFVVPSTNCAIISVLAIALRHERSYPWVRFSHLFPLHMFVSAARSAYASSRFWNPPVGTCLLHPRVRYLMGQVGGVSCDCLLLISSETGSLPLLFHLFPCATVNVYRWEGVFLCRRVLSPL